MKRLNIFLIILLLTAFMIGCEDYSSASVPTDGSSTTGSTPPQTADSTGHIHNYFGEVIPATCTDDGYMIHTCDCGHSFTDSTVSALGHTWSQWVTVNAPTETEEGLQSRTCQVCSAQDHQILEALGQSHSHSYSTSVVEPTCTEPGYTVYRCACGEEYNGDSVEALGHSWSDWTYTENSQTRNCAACGATDTLQSSHTHDYTAQTVAAACTEGGYKLYTCSCGESYREDVSDPLGHSWGSWHVVAEPTTSTEGVKERICEACGERETAPLDPLQVEDGFIILAWPENVTPGDKATVTIKGIPGVEYSITVYYKSGPATASGLEPAVADSDGYVSWTWRVSGRTTPGTYEIVISGGGVTQSFYYTILEKE